MLHRDTQAGRFSRGLLDLFTDVPTWAAWSEEHLPDAFDAGQVVINPIVYIGAHAAVTGRALLTRDANRYRTLLPALPLISP